MQSKILTLFTRTPLHVGAGSSVGAIDQPIIRERHTRFPVIPGSSLKGVLRDLFGNGTEETCWLFGNEHSEKDKDKVRAGALLIGEARVLAFPVRSAKGSFAWITCPLALARFKRDSGSDFTVPDGIAEEECLASNELLLDGKVVLEEYCLTSKGESDLWQKLIDLIEDEVWADLGKRFVVVSDEMFSYFCEHACEVVTRVRIDDETGVVAPSALFNQENVPSETLFYCAIAAQNEKKKGGNGRPAIDALTALKAKLDEAKVIQVGGDETIGLGYCTVNLCE